MGWARSIGVAVAGPLCGLVLVAGTAPMANAAWIFPGFAGPSTAGKAGVAKGRAATGHHAVVAASSGQPMRHAESTYVWRGIRVPVGACGAMVHGNAWVLPCADPRAVAYRRLRAQHRDEWAAGAVALVGLGAVGGFFAVRGGWHRRERGATWHA